MLEEALSFPRHDDDWLETVLIGGVLSLLGVLIVPAILVNGYLLRVMTAAVTGEETPPRFDDWGDMFVDGLLVWVVELVYVGVPSFLLAVVVGSFVAVSSVSTGSGAAPAQGAGAGAGLLVAVAVLAILGIVLVLAAFLLPAALANVARTGDVAAAFHLRTVARGAFTGEYVVAVVLAVAVSIVLGLVGAALSVVLVGIFVLFYLQVVVYHLFGQGFAAGLGEAAATASGPE